MNMIDNSSHGKKPFPSFSTVETADLGPARSLSTLPGLAGSIGTAAGGLAETSDVGHWD